MNAETRAKETGMTPEERAWEVACSIVTGDDTYDMAEKIATALRQAQNDKLEEAAQALGDKSASMPAMVAEYASAPLIDAAAIVRSLKSKDTP